MSGCSPVHPPNDSGLSHEGVGWKVPGRAAVIYAHEPDEAGARPPHVPPGEPPYAAHPEPGKAAGDGRSQVSATFLDRSVGGSRWSATRRTRRGSRSARCLRVALVGDCVLAGETGDARRLCKTLSLPTSSGSVVSSSRTRRWSTSAEAASRRETQEILDTRNAAPLSSAGGRSGPRSPHRAGVVGVRRHCLARLQVCCCRRRRCEWCWRGC